ncbi:hypothetical protein GF391_02955 [Candidatus Uhrbacteria bacterium]|nr:hypothetical protein [Candidatus Uhrbacteria bacterium]
METVFAYELYHDKLVVDEARCDDVFMDFLLNVMHAQLTRENGQLTAPAHYHDVFMEEFQSPPYYINDEEALKALREDAAEYHNSSPPQHVA